MTKQHTPEWLPISQAPRCGKKVMLKVMGHGETKGWFEGGEWLCQTLLDMRAEDDAIEAEYRGRALNAFQRFAPTRPPYIYEPTHFRLIEEVDAAIAKAKGEA